jgi:hypothetical protein
LIAAVKRNALKIIVFDWRQSAPYQLYLTNYIDGYVLKGRNTIYDLKGYSKAYKKWTRKFSPDYCTCFQWLQVK